MKKRTYISILILLISNIFFGQQKSDYLFLGNSLIKYKYNHTLEVLNNFLSEEDSINFECFAINGSRLWLLLRTDNSEAKTSYLHKDVRQAELYKKMKENQYKTIILQQDSEFDKINPFSTIDSSISYSFVKSFQIFDTLAKELNTKIIVFENYISFIKLKKKGDFDLFADSNYKAIKNNLSKLKEINQNLKVIPTGYLVMEFIKKYPKVRTKLLFSMHPHKNIQYLLACMFYIELTGNNPSNLSYNKIKPSFAKEIRKFTMDFYKEYYETN